MYNKGIYTFKHFMDKTTSINNDAPFEVIQNLMGHEKSETTLLYAQISGKLRKKFYQEYFCLFKTEKHHKCYSVLMHPLV